MVKVLEMGGRIKPHPRNERLKHSVEPEELCADNPRSGRLRSTPRRTTDRPRSDHFTYHKAVQGREMGSLSGDIISGRTQGSN